MFKTQLLTSTVIIIIPSARLLRVEIIIQCIIQHFLSVKNDKKLLLMRRITEGEKKVDMQLILHKHCNCIIWGLTFAYRREKKTKLVPTESKLYSYEKEQMQRREKEREHLSHCTSLLSSWNFISLSHNSCQGLIFQCSRDNFSNNLWNLLWKMIMNQTIAV